MGSSSWLRDTSMTQHAVENASPDVVARLQSAPVLNSIRNDRRAAEKSGPATEVRPWARSWDSFRCNSQTSSRTLSRRPLSCPTALKRS